MIIYQPTVSGSLIVSGSVIATDFTGSLQGTASFAITASYAMNGGGAPVDTSAFVTTSSFNSYTGSSASQFAGTASFAESASFATNTVSGSIQGQLDGKQPLVDNFLLNRLPNTAYTTVTNYVVAVQNTSFSTSALNSNNITRFVPFVLQEATDFDAFYIFQSNANAGTGSYMTMYIYDDSNGGLPGIKLHQDSTAAGSMNTTNGMHTFGTNVTLQPGAYWMAFHIRNLDTAGVNPTFYFTQNTNFRSIQFTVPAHGSNQYIYITVAATVGDLGDNPTLTATVAGLPQTIFVKFKRQ